MGPEIVPTCGARKFHKCKRKNEDSNSFQERNYENTGKDLAEK